MKTKAKRTTTMRRFALTAALLLILALLLAFDAINGDPLSQQWAIYRAIRYAEKLYPEETFHWDQRTAADVRHATGPGDCSTPLSLPWRRKCCSGTSLP